MADSCFASVAFVAKRFLLIEMRKAESLRDIFAFASHHPPLRGTLLLRRA